MHVFSPLPALFLGAGLTLLLGCVGDKTKRPRTWDEVEKKDPGAPVVAEAKSAPKSKRKSSDVYARSLPSPEACEREARRYAEASAKKGWMLLKSCVKRGDFTHIKPLLEEPWLSALSKRRGAAELLAHVMATRGGDVTGDLRLLHERRVPVFSLNAALKEPSVYEGRLVILRGRVGKRQSKGGKYAANVSQTALESTASDRAVGTKMVSERRSSYSDQRSGQASYKTDRNGSGSDQSRSSSSGSRSGKSTRGEFREVYDNASILTGVEVIVNLTTADPFLEPGMEYIMLVQFQSVRDIEDENAVNGLAEAAVVSMVAYYRPRASLSF